MDDTERRARLEAAGRWLREQRERRRFTTAGEFARAIGIDPSQLSRYERGMSAVPDNRAKQIADVLGMDIVEVRRGLRLWVPDPDNGDDTEPEPESPIPPMTFTDPDDQAFWDALSEAGRQRVMRIGREADEQQRRAG